MCLRQLDTCVMHVCSSLELANCYRLPAPLQPSSIGSRIGSGRMYWELKLGLFNLSLSTVLRSREKIVNPKW